MGTITVLGLESCNKALKTIGQNIIDKSDDVTKDLEGVSKIIIHAELNPAEIASFGITKEYIAEFKDCKERED